MPAISFHQGVALAMGAYIDPVTSNASFNLAATNFNVTNAYGVTIFGIDPTTSKPNNRLRCLFHTFSLPVNQTSQLDFASIPQLGDLASAAYTLVSTNTSVAANINDAGLTGYDTIFTGYNATHKQLDYIAGGDISGNGSVVKVERAYHRTGLAIWNKLKK